MSGTTPIDRLSKRIAALADPVTDSGERGRKLDLKGAGSALAALLREIAETQRPRTLTFSTQSGKTLTLQVRAGTILCVSDPTSDTVLAGAPDILGRPLRVGADNDKADLHNILQVFCGGASGLAVSSVPLHSDDLRPDAGMSIQGLDAGPEPHATIQNFAGRAAPFLAAQVLILEGQEAFAVGPAQQISALRSLATQNESRTTAKQADRQCVIIAARKTGTQAVICAAEGTQALYAVFADNDLDRILDLWRAPQTACDAAPEDAA